MSRTCVKSHTCGGPRRWAADIDLPHVSCCVSCGAWMFNPLGNKALLAEKVATMIYLALSSTYLNSPQQPGTTQVSQVVLGQGHCPWVILWMGKLQLQLGWMKAHDYWKRGSIPTDARRFCCPSTRPVITYTTSELQPTWLTPTTFPPPPQAPAPHPAIPPALVPAPPTAARRSWRRTWTECFLGLWTSACLWGSPAAPPRASPSELG